MSAKFRLKVVLCWHMHQPDYCDRVSGNYQLPWTYLHAIKDYVDMASLLEDIPEARAVVNFVPILLEQIKDYNCQVQSFLNDTGAIRDPLLAALDLPALPVGEGERLHIIQACLRVNKERLINRFPGYRKIAKLAEHLFESPELLTYIDEQYLADILVWYHIAWLGETVRRSDERVQLLISKGSSYTLHDRHLLLTIIGEQLATLIDRYRMLAENGQIELSVTPYAHPIIPLLLDLNSAKEALPDVELPRVKSYPGGEERARQHIKKSISSFQSYFGFAPKGCWPSEGSVSTATLELLGEYGFEWTASGQGVFNNSALASGEGEYDFHHPCLVADMQKPVCFFRDDGLSDLVGFTYSTWHGEDAAADLIKHLETIAKKQKKDGELVVPIILDGENAWEHYPDNGYHFLTALYKGLTEHPYMEMSTFSDVLASDVEVIHLPKLVAGSWVYGTFSTWIGNSDKNRGWEILCDAKRAFDNAVETGFLTGQQLVVAEKQLAICEGSDWFWWFGDDNPSDTVRDFDRLYRLHLANLYQMIGEEPPEYLSKAISFGGGNPSHGGVMKTGQA